MRSVPTILVFLSFFLSGIAAADLPDEHPEWFGYTAPLEVDGTIQWTSTLTKVWIAPEVADAYYETLINALLPEAQLSVLAQGGQDQLDLYSWFELEGFTPSQQSWIDVELLDTDYVGEWGPVGMQVGDGGGAFLLDGRYYGMRPNDDAAAGRMAQALDAPLHRIPLFLSRAYLAGSPDGLCLVGPEIYNTNLGHTAAEIEYGLERYAGCTATIPIPAPSEDLKKKPMDLYVRFSGSKASAGEGTAWGVFLGDASDWSLSLQEGMNEVRDALEAEPIGERTVVIDVPWPETADGAYRSYLPYVLLDGAMVLPTYMGIPTLEESITLILLQELGEIEIRDIPSDLAAPFEKWPSRLVGGGAGGSWSSASSPPILCDSGDPSVCDDCLPECGEVTISCVEDAEEPAVEGCITGPDGCLDLYYEACAEGKICEQGECKDPPTTCDTLPEGGICQGNTIVSCVAGVVKEVHCASDSSLCGYTEDGIAKCFPLCPEICDALGDRTCSETPGAFRVCEIGPEGCLEWVESLCPDGEVCVEGFCGEGSADAPGDVIVPGDGGAIDPIEGPSVNAGYGKADGCSTSGIPCNSASPLLLMLLLVFLEVRWYRRPLYNARRLP